MIADETFMTDINGFTAFPEELQPGKNQTLSVRQATAVIRQSGQIIYTTRRRDIREEVLP